MAWWWFRRRYEDITERHAVLVRNQNNAPATVTKSDLEASIAAGFGGLRMPDVVPLEERMANLERAVSSIAIPDPDLSGIEGRLEMIEAGLSSSATDQETASASLSSLSERLSDLGSRIGSMSADDTSNVSDRVDALSTAITEKQWVDLRPLEARMARLEAAVQSTEPPAVDLSSIHSALGDIQLLIESAEKPQIDLAPIQGQLDHLVEAVADLRQNQPGSAAENLDAITSQLTSISSTLATMERPDMEPVLEMLSGVERRISEQTIPYLEPIDEQMQGLYVRLANLEGVLTAQQPAGPIDIEPLHRQIDGLASQIMAPDQNFDVLYGRLTSLTETIAGIEAALGALRSQVGTGQYGSDQGMDMIERRLAAVQESMLGLRQPDLTPVLGQLRAMDSRFDVASLENRLSAIEYSLNSLHQILRSRDMPDYSPQIPRQPAQTYLPPQPLETRSYYSSPITPPSSLANSTYRAPEPTPMPSDPIEAERRPDDQANLLVRPAFGKPDDLERISGVGPKLRDMLHGIGVYYFWQVSEWSPEQVEWVDSLLDAFHGRIERDNWVSQARMMAAEPTSVRRPGS
ncbi:MAG: hypothetical protein AAF996_17285 [Pseudomonadota bacterium]